MLDEKFTAPPSPPTSPRMSDAGLKAHEHQWQQSSATVLSSAEALQPQSRHTLADEALPAGDTATAEPEQNSRPLLRSYKSFPYSLGPSSRTQDCWIQDPTNSGSIDGFTERVLSQGPQPTASAHLQQPTYGGSAPASPAPRLTPDSPKDEKDDVEMDEDEIEIDLEDAEQAETERPPMTAAELRAYKRKLKRFRLTHNQTRFLMSEFARQAHPDAAHRERLSREIPGLSPRQVQVWFQNRRAKLKRLTTDDRERMMRSRALPADFDMTQALHSPFGAPTPNLSTPVSSPGTFASFNNNNNALRPLTLDTMRRAPDQQPYGQPYINSTGITPALGSFAFTPPQSATDTVSPSSAVSNMSPFSYQTQESPRRHPFGGPPGPQSTYPGQVPQMPRLHTHDRIIRPFTEVAGSPLRTSMSYSGLNSGTVCQNQPERTQSFSEHQSYTHERPRQSRSVTNPNMGAAGPYGLGFSYAQPSNYYTPEQSRHNSISTITQPIINTHQYRRGSSSLAGPPITYPQYPSANFSTPQKPQYSRFNTGFVSRNFQQSYQQEASEPPQMHSDNSQQVSSQPQQGYAPIPDEIYHFVPLVDTTNRQDADQGDNSDGGVSLPRSH